VEKSGFRYIGPSAETIRLMGNKVSAIRSMIRAGVPTVPGSNGPPRRTRSAPRPWPGKSVTPLIKAASGGGGRGMQVVHSEHALLKGVHVTQREAQGAFGDETVYLEKYLERPRHVEIQVLADTHGNVIHLGDRDCSLQRRNQKVMEEAPAPNINPESRNAHSRPVSPPVVRLAMWAPEPLSSCTRTVSSSSLK